jgi:hypothetical protein
MILIQLLHSFVLWFFPRVWVRHPDWVWPPDTARSGRLSVPHGEISLDQPVEGNAGDPVCAPQN